MDGLDDDEELHFAPCVMAEDAGKDGQPNLHGTATLMKCLYAHLVANKPSAKALSMAEGTRERTPSEIEEDARRVEERLLASTPSPQDFLSR